MSQWQTSRKIQFLSLKGLPPAPSLPTPVPSQPPPPSRPGKSNRWLFRKFSRPPPGGRLSPLGVAIFPIAIPPPARRKTIPRENGKGINGTDAGKGGGKKKGPEFYLRKVDGVSSWIEKDYGPWNPFRGIGPEDPPVLMEGQGIMCSRRKYALVVTFIRQQRANFLFLFRRRCRGHCLPSRPGNSLCPSGFLPPLLQRKEPFPLGRELEHPRAPATPFENRSNGHRQLRNLNRSKIKTENGATNAATSNESEIYCKTPVFAAFSSEETDISCVRKL